MITNDGGSNSGAENAIADAVAGVQRGRVTVQAGDLPDTAVVIDGAGRAVAVDGSAQRVAGTLLGLVVDEDRAVVTTSAGDYLLG